MQVQLYVFIFPPACLLFLINSLNIEVIGFGSTFTSLLRKSKAYNDKSLAEATQHVNQLKAGILYNM